MTSFGIHSRSDTGPRTPAFIADKLRILCATDLSESSEHAVQRALLLTQQLDAQLLLLHVVDGRQLHQVIALQAERAQSALEPQARQPASMDEPNVAISVRVGIPHQTIADVAREWHADLVVLGAYRKRIGDRFLGTTAERIARAAVRPVLIVSGEAKTSYQRALLASDLSDEFIQIAHMTQRLGLLGDARTSLVHALEPVSARMLYAAGIAEPELALHLSSVSQNLREALLEQVQSLGLGLSEVYVTQGNARPFRGIERIVEDANPQLLVMGMSRHTLFEQLLSSSVVNEAVRKIECDVLIASPAAAQQVRSTLDSRVRPAAAHLRGTATGPARISEAEVIQ